MADKKTETTDKTSTEAMLKTIAEAVPAPSLTRLQAIAVAAMTGILANRGHSGLPADHALHAFACATELEELFVLNEKNI